MSREDVTWERLRGLDLDLTDDDAIDTIDESDELEMSKPRNDDDQKKNSAFDEEDPMKSSIAKTKVCDKCNTAATSLQQKIINQEKTITQQAELIEKLRNEITSFKEANTENNSGNDCKKRKRGDTVDEMNLAMVADSFNKDEKIRELNKEIEILKYDLRHQNAPKAVADKSTESKLTRTLPNSPPLPNISTLLQDLQKGVEKKITDMKVAIEASLEKKISDAFESKSTPSTLSYAAATTNYNSKLQAPKQGNQFRTIMAETKNEEILFENDRQRREANIIVHGVKERSKCTESLMKEHDKTYINELFAILGVKTDVKSIVRLGKFDPDGKCRPIKVIMNSVDDKHLVMSRLPNLKSAEEQFKKISVKDDYTPSERDLIKYKYQQAQEMNVRDNTTEWKVRGSPKNGLRIVKIKTIASNQEPTSSKSAQ